MTTLLDETLSDETGADHHKATEAIQGHVLRRLGGAAEFRVRVQPLWANHYRVNVYAGLGGPEAAISHSFFLVADAAGNVLASTPALGGPG